MSSDQRHGSSAPDSDQPENQPKQGLTGKFSNLFRRDNNTHSRPPRSPTSKKRFAGANSKPNAAAVAVSVPVLSSSSKNIATSSGDSKNSANKSSVDDGDIDDGDLASVSTRGSTLQCQRLFYSSAVDDDSDDSYESRAGRKVTQSGSFSVDSTKDSKTCLTRDSDAPCEVTEGFGKTILRYRGFSTSIKSLFLDESLVCASMGCFGLILSNRSEYLLQLRNEQRGTISPEKQRNLPQRKRTPSRIVAYFLLLTILLIFSTFVIWGFGGNGTNDDMGYNPYYNDYNNGQQAADYDDYLNNDYFNNKNDDQRNQYQNQNNNNDDQFNQKQYSQYNQNKYNQYQQNVYNQYQQNNNNQNQQNVYDQYQQNQQNQYNQYQQNQQNQYNQYQQNQNYNNNDDDGGNYNGDDGGNYNGDDGGNYNGDDGGNYNDDDGGNNNDDGGGRQRQRHLDLQADQFVVTMDGKMPASLSSQSRHHHINGITKLRDYHENVLDPIIQFIQDEWYREEYAKEEPIVPNDNRHRRNEDAGSYEEEADIIQQQELARNIRIALIITFLMFLGVLGRRRRMRTRFYLVRARAQDDNLYYASAGAGSTRRLQIDESCEDEYEGACSHTLCGCYPVDEDTKTMQDDVEEEFEVRDTGIFKRKKKPHNDDIVARCFNCLMASCCGFICKCWCQCLSVCALAQEAREIRLLVPPRYQRIDFITHQPFHEYQKAVNNLRRGWMGKTRRMAGIKPHYDALSRLSRYIVIVFTLVTVTLTLTLIFNPRAVFSWKDAVVLIATFAQSFMVLFIVHYIFHKSDLSLDAVIKMFAAGFLIAVPSAFVFEGLLINTVCFVVWTTYEVIAHYSGYAFEAWVTKHWGSIWLAGELLNAYIVAAVTEELCKYYCFRAVEHPDLIFLTGLQRERQDDSAVDGGSVKYPFGSHKVQELSNLPDDDDQSISQYSHRSNYGKRPKRSQQQNLITQTGTCEDEFDEDENDVRTYRQKAMAITTAMISIAVGLACAENCLYVFVLGSNSSTYGEDMILEEWIVLFFRSIFPIHALAAAMQSINMIRKFVELDHQKGHRIGVGRIILPAVLLHGTFDAILMAINVYIEMAWAAGDYDNNGTLPYNALLVNVTAWAGISLTMLVGIFWYFRENRKQRLRLILLEQKEKTKLSGVSNEEAEIL